MIITPAKFEDEMHRISEMTSPEAIAMEFEELCCETLKSLGYDAGIRIYDEQIGKWYYK